MRNAAETRTKLLETAVQLIWRSSYHQVGVNEICKQAGVTKGAFYHHFGSKAELFYTAGHHYWDSKKDFFDEVYSPELSPLDQLHLFIDKVLDKRLTQIEECEEVVGCPIVTIGAQVGPDDEKVRQMSQELSENAETYLLPLVRGLKAENMLEGDPDVSLTARRLHQYYIGVSVHAQLFKDESMMNQDLQPVTYQLLGLKQEYWRDVTTIFSQSA